MHRDNKLKREEIRELFRQKHLSEVEKKPDPRAVEKFKAVPYQKIYAERMKANELGGLGKEKGEQAETC